MSCPKCNNDFDRLMGKGYVCGSYHSFAGKLYQSKECRVIELEMAYAKLEEENRKLHRKLRLLSPDCF